MSRKMVAALSLGALVFGSTAVAVASPASLSLANAEAAAKAEYVLPQVCVSGAKTFVGTNGKEYTCQAARVTPWECLEDQDDYLALDGKQYTCEELQAARPKVGRGPGFFGYAAIALVASGGAAAAAQGSNGRPASP